MPRKPATAKPRKPRKYPTEAEITKQIRAWLDTKPDNVWHFKTASGGGGGDRGFIRQKTGIPDIICCVNGFFVTLEVKTKVGKLTQTQEKEFPKIERALGPVYVVRSLEDAQRELAPYLQTSVVGIMP